MMQEVGRVCVKIAGRDSNKTCVIVDVIDQNFVMIDGETRRRKCNIDHLEPLNKTLDIKKGATHAEVKKAFDTLGIKVLETKPKKATVRPKRAKAVKAIESDKKKPVKK
jgi:large subunit ribosomal protein L14e